MRALKLPQKFYKEINKDKNIIAVLVFGSYIRERGKEKYYKDIDLCLVLDKKYSNLEMSGKRIKYYSILPDKFDIQIFQQLPIYIRIRILKEGKILLCKNEDLLYDIALNTIKEFDDFKEIYKSYIKNALK